MKVIICGAGQVGSGIAEHLAAEGNDVTLIDNRPEVVQRANDMLDVRALLGHGSHPEVLEQAGAREADMLIAATLHDEINMVACQVASTLFDIPTKIARVRAQTYLNHEWARLFSRDRMGIDSIISPEVEVGEAVIRRIELPGAFETASFADGKVRVVGLRCGPECPVVDTPLRQLGELFPDLPSVIVAIVRQGRLFVPHGDDQLILGDDVYFIAPAEQVARTLSIFGQEDRKARRVLIIGGGNVGFYVAQQIEQRQPNLRVKVIEASRARAVEIAELLERTVVLNGTALSADLLREADIANVDTVAALTNDDQVNILTSVLAKQLGARRSLSLINASGFANITQTFGIDSHVNPRATTVGRILQHVRRGRIRAIHSVQNGEGEVVEAEVLETSAILGKPLKDLGVSDGVRFGAIVRGGKVLKPTGTMHLETKDRVVLFAAAGHVREVEQLFRVSLEYF